MSGVLCAECGKWIEWNLDGEPARGRCKCARERPLTPDEIKGALSRAHCGTCGHLLQEHGQSWCSVLACACRQWVAGNA